MLNRKGFLSSALAVETVACQSADIVSNSRLRLKCHKYYACHVKLLVTVDEKPEVVK